MHYKGKSVHKRILALLASWVISGCVAVGAAERDPIDCSIEKPDTILQRCEVVRHASEFGDSCIASAAFSGHSCLVLDTDATFCETNESFPLTVVLTQDDVTLNCAGGLIDHGWPMNSSDASQPGSRPITASGKRFPAVHALSDRSLDNITIRNCHIARTGHMGINLSRFFGGQLHGDELPQGHSNIRIEDVRIEETVTGVFLGTYSRAITMDRLIIDGTERISIYSEAGSHDVKLRDSVIANNQSREALAFDSTYDSEVSDTLFVNNREGGINLYQNCGELKGIVCPVERSTPPNNNQLLRNAFVHNGMSGVQIASRQGRNHGFGWCKSLNGLPGKHRDTADNNVVQDNTFVCTSGTALRVLDGPNLVTGNQIVADGLCVPLEISTGGLGKYYSERLNGIVVKDNDIQSQRLPRLRNIGDGVELQP